LKRSREILLEKIAEREEVVENGARFIELNKIDMPTGKQMDEFMKLKPLAKFNLKSEADIAKYRLEIDAQKKELSESDSVLEIAEREKRRRRRKIIELTCSKCRASMILFLASLGGSKRKSGSLKNAEKADGKYWT